MKGNNGKAGAAYSALAEYYDFLAAEDDYESRGERLKFLAEKYANGKKCADLACGSGYFTIKLKEIGFDVFGADISREMLTEAEKNSAQKGLFIEYRLQDIVNFKNFEKLDLVTVINDGFNYLDEEKMKKAFKSISKSLKTGGVMIFDVSSEFKIKQILANNVFAEDLDDLTYLWFNELDGDRLTMSLTFFIKQGENYIRKDETHVQYAHSFDSISKALNEASFEILKVFGDSYGETCDTDKRLNFVVGKKRER